MNKQERETALHQLVVERDKARKVLAAAQVQVDELSFALSELLVTHLEEDHNVGVLSYSVGSLKSYHKHAHQEEDK